MFGRKDNFKRLILTAVITLGLSATALPQKSEEKKESDGQKKGKEMPVGTPVLWKDPGEIASRNLLAGPGGEEMKPDLSNVTFVKEEPGGYSVKFRVKDGTGKEWVAKLGNEARPETASLRLVWAVGYVSEVNYLAPCVKIAGAPKPFKDVPKCEGGGFADVRFEARPETVKRLENWSWKDNPFRGTKELKGLVVLMALLNNWDLKDSNNKIIHVPGGEGAPGELHYVVSDLGATFGKTGNFITHSRNEPEKYVKTKFVEKVEGNAVRFHFDGKQGDMLREITVEDAKWIGGLLAQLTDGQLADAFRAANFKPEEVQALVEEVRSRISELNNLPAEQSSETPAPTPAPTPVPTPAP